MIKFNNVSFSYASGDGKGSLQNISLQINEGEVVLLTGPSGCGKSTILRMINGLIPHYYEGEISGDVLVADRNPVNSELHEMAEITGTVFQNPRSQFFNVDSTSELAFGCENQGMPEDEILKRIEKTVERFNLTPLLDRSLFRLSGGEKQKIACASIDVPDLPIILMDEPSANLDADATLQMREIISTWKSMGKTIIIAEHRISYIWDIVDRVVLMENGTIRKEYSDKLHLSMTDEERKAFGLRSFRWENPADIMLEESSPEGYYEIKDLSFGYEKNHPLWHFDSLKIPKNSITAIRGSNGCGKTTFLNCLSGIEKHCKVEMYDGDRLYKKRDLKKRIFLVMQDVNHQLFTEDVLDEVLISMNDEDEEKAHEILKTLDLDIFADRHPMSLSGGQKQRTAIASAVASGRDILLFDEPTSGLDYRHMLLTAELFKKLKEMNKTILIVTHDSELIRCCCDNIITIEKQV